jgi:hypothetical protein
MNSTEYHLWWEQNPSVPYGTCWCGRPTKIAKETRRGPHTVKDKPECYLLGLGHPKLPEVRVTLREASIRLGVSEGAILD